jgi:uncharacterized protein DUF3303
VLYALFHQPHVFRRDLAGSGDLYIAYPYLIQHGEQLAAPTSNDPIQLYIQAVSHLTKDLSMLFMIIERFKDDDMLPIYKRVRDEGRMLPDGLTYMDSWIEPNFSRCFQLMECDDLRLLQQWTLSWRGSGATFEIVPVVSSKDTREVVAPLLDSL